MMPMVEQVFLKKQDPPTVQIENLKTIEDCIDCIVVENDVRSYIKCSLLGNSKYCDVTLSLENGYNETKSVKQYSHLTFYPNASIHHKTKVTCTASCNKKPVPLIANAQIYVRVVSSQPPSLQMSYDDYVGHATDDDIDFTCLVSNIRPAAQNITLSINGTTVDGLELKHCLDSSTDLYSSWVTFKAKISEWDSNTTVRCYEYNNEFTTDDYLLCSTSESVFYMAMNLTKDMTGTESFVREHAEYWLDGFHGCQGDKNVTDEDFKLPYNKTYIAEMVEIHGPIWMYGLEVKILRNGMTHVFRIYRRDPDLPAVGVCSGRDPTMSVTPSQTLKDTERRCNSVENTSIPIVTPSNITLFVNPLLQNSTFWVANLTEELFINDKSIHVDVRCMLYDKNGDIRTENCESHYKTFCVSDYKQPVVQYVNNITLPWLPRTPTKGTSSSTNSKSTNSHGSKRPGSRKFTPYPTGSSSTPSSSSSSKSGILMDPQIRFTVIGTCCAIVVAIIVAVLICCCKRKKKTSSNKRQSTKLADNYSETVDSMAMKEQKSPAIYETPNNSEYATPDDAIRKARQRQSIGENEYDVINADPKKKKPTGLAANAYNHVTLVSSKDKQNNIDLDENQYDVTNYGRQQNVFVSPKDNSGVGNEYGHVEIKVER